MDEDVFIIFNEQEVDIIWMVWLEGVENRWQMDEDWICVVIDILDFVSIDQVVKEVWIWFWEWVVRVLLVY